MLRIFFVLILSLIFLCGEFSYASNDLNVQIKVVDEDNIPIEGAKVGMGFNYNTGNGTRNDGRQGLSNSDGIFYASGKGNGHISYGASKEGYYSSNYVYDFNYNDMNKNETTSADLVVVLRKTIKPVSMYVRNSKISKIEIPVANKDVGFDLTLFDWVEPYGHGKISDFIFNLNRNFISWNDQKCELEITFSNEYDGIQLIEEDIRYGSAFKLPRYAHEQGYKNKLELYIHASNGNLTSNFNDNDNYIFRIRSQKDESGKLIGMYGKILGPIKFSTPESNTATIIFNYYLNPDNTANLEFDINNNLFKNLPRMERITYP